MTTKQVAAALAGLALTSLLLFRCGSFQAKDGDKGKSDPTSTTTATGTGTGTGEGTSTSAFKPFPASKLTTITYDSATDEVTATVESDVCNDANIQLEISDVCAESSPLQCSAELVADNADFNCDHESPKKSTFTASVASLKERPASLAIRSGDKSLGSILLPAVGAAAALDAQLGAIFKAKTGLELKSDDSVSHSCTQDSDCVTADWSTWYLGFSTCDGNWISCDAFNFPERTPDCTTQGALMNASTKAKLAKFYADAEAKTLCEGATVFTRCQVDYECADTSGEPKCDAGKCRWSGN